ncbi:MAG: hypothetical protein ACRYG7_43925 [Janthinobacterium lividum]
MKLNDGAVATSLNITEHKIAEQQLTRNLRLLEQAEQVAGLSSWDYELVTGRFLWSGGMHELFGLSPDQPVTPLVYLDYVVDEDHAPAEQLVQRITTGAGDFETTLRLRVASAVKRLRLKSVVLRNAQGQGVRVCWAWTWTPASCTGSKPTTYACS